MTENSEKSSRQTWIDLKPEPGLPPTSLAAGIGVLVGGYYIFEAVVYPALAVSIPFFGVTDARAALAELAPNLLQGTLSALVAFGIWRVFHRPATD